MNKVLSAVVIITLFSSCSLLKVELENQAEPLSQWQMSVRNGVQTFAGAMSLLVVQCGDSVASVTINNAEIPNAIRWKLGFTSSIRRSAFVADPELSLLDSWTFAKQHKDFFNRYGRDLFPENYEIVLHCSDSILSSIEQVSSKVYTSNEFEHRKNFVYTFAEGDSLKNLTFERNFILFSWKEYLDIPDSLSVVSVGNLPQVLSNFSTKFGYYTETAPDQVKWQLDLFKYGIESDSTLQSDLDNTKAQLNRLVLVAEQTPGLVDSTMQQLDMTVARLERSFNSAMFVFDKNWVTTVDKLSVEREELTKSLSEEREVMMEDLNDLSTQVADQALGHIKGIIRSILIFAILFILLLFGLPFFAGFYLGKFFQRRKNENPVT